MKPDPALFCDTRPAPALNYAPPLEALRVIHSDDDILVIDKPEGLLSIPARYSGHQDSVLTRAVTDYPNASVVHRLDMETSGVMVLALHDRARRHLSRQFEQKRAQKTYIAEVHGVVGQSTGVIDLPIAPDRDNLPKQMICLKSGRPAVTNWEVLRRNDNSTRLALTPKTGRSHQLRLHLRACGHAIIGDRFYAEAVSDATRLMLHAERLKIRHPSNNHFISFEVACPF